MVTKKSSAATGTAASRAIRCDANAFGSRVGRIEHDPQGEDRPWRERQRALSRHDWVVYAKTALGGPAQVLEYLSRYTHRTAISNERIRHYGLLAAACKAVKLEYARQALQLPAGNPQAVESAKDFMARVARIDVLLCPSCRSGRLHVVQVLVGPRQLPAPERTVANIVPANRGPP